MNKERIIIDISVTYECNFKCLYCYEDTNLKKCKVVMDDITINATINYIKNLLQIYDIQINFFGGEPFLAPNVMNKFITELKDSVSYIIVTNGVYINKYIENILYWKSIAKKFLIAVSYDYSLQNKNRCKNSYDIVRSNIKLLHMNNIPVKTITVFLREDLILFDDVIKDFLSLRNEIPNLVFNFNVDRRNITTGINMIEVVNALTRGRRLTTENIIKYNVNLSKNEQCIVGRYYNGISPKGEIFPIGNISHESLDLRKIFYLGTVFEDIKVLQDRHTKFFTSFTGNKIYKQCQFCCVPCKIPQWNFTIHQNFDFELCKIQKLIARCL